MQHRPGTTLLVHREPESWGWGPFPGEEHRFLLLDVDDESTMLIAIATDQGDMDALVAEAMPIIESLTIAP